VDFDRTKTLVQLKREKFRDYSWDFHPFPARYYLRNVPLHQFTEADIMVLIQQSIGLDYLVVMAFERLEQEPLLKCRSAEGDLLSAVLCADALVWRRNPDCRARVASLWRKISAKLVARQQSPEIRRLFADYRWFVKAELFLPTLEAITLRQ